MLLCALNVFYANFMFVNCVKTVEVMLTDYGKVLREIIGLKLNLPLDHFKLIAAGRVIEDGTVINEQGVAVRRAYFSLNL